MRLSALDCALSELRKKSDVILVQVTNISDAMLTHADPLNAQAEGKTGDLLGVVTNGSQYIGVDHAGPSHLHPSSLAGSVRPVHIDLDTRLGEREERRAKTDMHSFSLLRWVVAEITLTEESQDALQVGHGYALIDK